MHARELVAGRADVKGAVDDLVALRMNLTAAGRSDGELPDAMTYLREREIDLPTGATLHLVRTVHEGDVTPQAPMCNDGEFATPVNCRRINGRFVCDWVC